MEKIDHNAHSVYLMYYHLIMVVKYRRKVINDPISERAKINEVLGNSDLKNGLAAFEAINVGDKMVYPLFESYCRNLAITILNLQTIFDMETFVIGGGISAQPILIEEVNRQFDKVHHEIDFIGKIIKRPKIVACHHHNGANLIGAAYFLKQK